MVLRVVFLLFFWGTGFAHLADQPSWHQPLLLIGAPKSGLEEVSGKDVYASWLLAVTPPPGVKGPVSDRITFDHIFHQVKHPLKVIAALVYEEQDELLKHKNYIFASVPEISKYDQPFVKRAKIWYYFNLRAQEKAKWTYRYEDLPGAFLEIEDRLGISLDFSSDGKPPKMLTWDKLKERLTLLGEEELYYKIKELAGEYGYN